LIKQDLVQNIVERTGLPRSKAEAAVDTIFDGMKRALASGDRIELRGFGVFNVRPRKSGLSPVATVSNSAASASSTSARARPASAETRVPAPK